MQTKPGVTVILNMHTMMIIAQPACSLAGVTSPPGVVCGWCVLLTTLYNVVCMALHHGLTQVCGVHLPYIILLVGSNGPRHLTIAA